jgi:hypothetical protein
LDRSVLPAFSGDLRCPIDLTASGQTPPNSGFYLSSFTHRADPRGGVCLLHPSSHMIRSSPKLLHPRGGT